MLISDWSSDVCSSDLPAHLPEQPLQDLGALMQVRRDQLAGLLGKIEEDRPGLEQRYGTAAIGGLGIDDRRDTVVGRDRQENGRSVGRCGGKEWGSRCK